MEQSIKSILLGLTIGSSGHINVLSNPALESARVSLLPDRLYPSSAPTYIDDALAKKMTLPEKCFQLSKVKQMKRYADMQFSKMAGHSVSYPAYKFSQTVFKETYAQAINRAENMLNGWANESPAVSIADGVTVERDGIVVTSMARPFNFFGIGDIMQALEDFLNGNAPAVAAPPQAQRFALAYAAAYDVVHTETQLLAAPSREATQAEWDAAPRVPFDSKKREFVRKLKVERNQLAARLESRQRNPKYDYFSMQLQREEEHLLGRMDKMLFQADHVAFYEVQSPPANKIPASYASEGPQKGIHFAKGIYTFQLAFHEMSHHLQMKDPERTHTFLSNSAREEVSFDVDGRDDKTYLAREEEVYQWAVQFVLSKLGDLPQKMAYAVDELKGIQDTVAQMREMTASGRDERTAFLGPLEVANGANKQLESVCNLIQGKHPQIYEVADQLFRSIGTLPDLTKEEKNSLILLTAAYYGIRFEPSGQLVYDGTAMQTLLQKFYSKHLHQH